MFILNDFPEKFFSNTDSVQSLQKLSKLFHAALFSQKNKEDWCLR